MVEKRQRCPFGTLGRSGWHNLCHAFLGAHSHSTSSLQTLLRGALMRLLLASSSPRRRELLSLLVSDFESSAPDIDESPRTAESPADYVARLAREKAKAGECLFSASRSRFGVLLPAGHTAGSARGSRLQARAREEEVITRKSARQKNTAPSPRRLVAL